jgi:O-antigen ligase
MVGITGLYLVRERLGRKSFLLLVGLALVITLLVVGPGSAVFLSRFTKPRELGSVVVRMFLMREGWRRVLAHLPFGMGFGQGVVAPDYLGPTSPHNFLITLGYEVGIPGVAIWLASLGVIVRRASDSTRDHESARLAQAILFTLGAAVINSLFEPTFDGLHFQFLFYWIMGILLGTLTRRQEELAGLETAALERRGEWTATPLSSRA